MNYLIPLILVGLGILYYVFTRINQKTPTTNVTGVTEASNQKGQVGQKRVLPFHLTSHPATDNPCICEYVFDRLDESGICTDKMTFTQVQDAYYKLRKSHPEYLYLSVG